MTEDDRRQELIDLGFPSKAIEESVRARAMGLFKVTLTPEETETLVSCIMERIIPLLPRNG